MPPRTGIHRRTSPATTARALLLLLAISGCGPRHAVVTTRDPDADSFDVVTSFEVRNGRGLPITVTPLPSGAYRFGLFARPSPGLGPLPAMDKIHPDLSQRIALGPSADREVVQVTFADTVRISRFPAYSPWLLSPSADTAAKTSAAETMVTGIRLQRGPERAADSSAVAVLGATVVDNSFWLTRTLVIELPRGSIPALAALRDVIYVRPAGPTEGPPQMNPVLGDNPARVRDRVGAKPYVAAELQRGRIALLDTGVNCTHEMFAAPGQFGRLADEVNRSATNEPIPLGSDSDLAPDPGHGTLSAGILNGRVEDSPESWGLTRIMVDSYRIYQAKYDPQGRPGAGLVGPALQHALEKTLSEFGGVIVVEAQANEPHDGGLANAADQAFDGGAVIVAANGNSDVGTLQVRSPANARKVLGIGAYDVGNGDDDEVVIPGPALDGRVKPDLQAPNGFETACKGSYKSYSSHDGSSGATAVAGGAAALFRNLLAGPAASVDPGFVYAGLLASAAPPPVTPDPSIHGAGRLVLPNNAWIWRVKLSLANDQHCVFEINPSGLPLVRLAAAIWWPERAVWENSVAKNAHSDVAFTLDLVGGGTTRVSSFGPSASVFRQARTPVPSPMQKVVVDVHARVVRKEPQEVYFVMVGYGAPGPVALGSGGRFHAGPGGGATGFSGAPRTRTLPAYHGRRFQPNQEER